jgi:hypothetical protein
MQMRMDCEDPLQKKQEIPSCPYKDQFYTGAIKQGVSKETIDTVWDMILSFEGYSFCKAHSASYAIVSFQSAYLKAHIRQNSWQPSYPTAAVFIRRLHTSVKPVGWVLRSSNRM